MFTNCRRALICKPCKMFFTQDYFHMWSTYAFCKPFLLTVIRWFLWFFRLHACMEKQVKCTLHTNLWTTIWFVFHLCDNCIWGMSHSFLYQCTYFTKWFSRVCWLLLDIWTSRYSLQKLVGHVNQTWVIWVAMLLFTRFNTITTYEVTRSLFLQTGIYTVAQ